MNFSQKALLTILGKFSVAAIALLVSSLLSRLLGVSGIGQYQVIITTQTIAITILAMGFGNASIFFINNQKVSSVKIVSNILKVYFWIAILFIAIFSGVIFLNSNYFGILDWKCVLFFTIGSAALLLYNLLLPILYVDLDVIKIQILSVLSGVVLLFGVLLFYFFQQLDINVILAISGFSNFLPFLLLIYYLRNKIDLSIKLDYSLIKKIFIYGVKISATNFVFLLSSNLVIFLLKGQLENGFQEVGLFSRAATIVNMVVLIPSSIAPLIFSKWAGASKDKLGLEVETILRILNTINYLGIITIFLFGEKILILLFGKEFIDAVPALNVMILSIVFSAITIVLMNLYSSIGKPMVILSVFFVSLLITAIVAYFCIPFLNSIGAGLSVMIGVVFNGVVLFILANREVKIKLKKVLIIRTEDIHLLKTIFNKPKP
ncbi:MAG TPA: polysaccharide biosynthesis C-terminal domain-containing protein [Edaphocola sp.]|nr:polysaccharide biosynthesis C-terminal domain-containing protein [Edaphocola sp.]